MSVEINDLENTEIDTTYIDDIKSSRIEDFYIDNIVNIPLIKGEKGDKGDKGDKPVAGVDYYTEAEKAEFKNAVIQDSKTDIDEYTSSKKNEYNDNATEKIQEYNSNAISKTETFNTNAQNKIDEYNTNAESLINKIAGVESKNTEQDTNIANKVDKEAGKGLSSNDYTDAEKEKLASLSNYNDTEIKADITGIKSKNTEQDTNIANKVDKEVGKGLSSNNYTDAEKEKLASLSNYNDTEIKADITGIKSTDTEQDKKIAELEKENIKLRNQIPNGQASGNAIHIEDSSDLELKWKLKGGHNQEIGENSPSLEYPSEIETVGSNINLFDKDNVNKINAYFDSTIHSNSANRVFWLKIDKNQDYTISKVKGKVFGIAFTDQLPKAGVKIYGTKYNNTGEVITTNSGSYDYLVCYYWSTSDVLTEQQIIDSIKIEKGTVATPYSPYGMGSVKIDVVNNNLSDFNVTQDGKVKVNEDGTITINGKGGFSLNFRKFIVKANTKYYLRWELISGTVSGANIFMNPILKKGWINKDTFVESSVTEDSEISSIWINGGAVFSNAKIKIWISKSQNDFTKHQFQTITMPIQQEMLEEDYIDDMEHHEWKKLILTGSESNIKKIPTDTYNRFQLSLTSYGVRNYIYCTHYLAGNSVNSGELDISFDGKYIVIHSPSDEITKEEQFKTWLKQQYDAGTPVIVYYKLATPFDLELTTEQKAIREQKLHTYKNVTNISLSNDLSSVDVSYNKDVETITKNCVQKEDGKELSSNNYTDAEKEKLASLSNYNDTEIKADITGIKSKNTEQDTNIANKVDKEVGKGLSSNNYTDAEKEKLASLSNYNDTEIKADITGIKSKNTEQDTNIANKVDKEVGKGLSSNDYTNAEKEKLTNIEENAEVNIIESIKKNGVALKVEDKAVDIVVPTKTSELINDSGFLDNTYSNNFLGRLYSLEDKVQLLSAFIYLAGSESQKNYTVVTEGILTEIELDEICYKNDITTNPVFNKDVPGLVRYNSILEISGAVKFYTTPKVNCNINVGVFKKESDSETPTEIFSVDILKSSIDSKVSACIPNIHCVVGAGDIIFLAFKCDETGDYTIIQDEKSSFLKIKKVAYIEQRPV